MIIVLVPLGYLIAWWLSVWAIARFLSDYTDASDDGEFKLTVLFAAVWPITWIVIGAVIGAMLLVEEVTFTNPFRIAMDRGIHHRMTNGIPKCVSCKKELSIPGESECQNCSA